MNNDKLSETLAVVPVIIMVTLVDVLIASIVSINTFLHCVLILNLSKPFSLGVAILVAIAVTAYIRLQPKIRKYIDTRSRKA